jgi:ribosomal protein S18 acetylase RimI-like enzyme
MQEQDRQRVRFGVCEMEYRGPAVASTLPLTRFDESYYEQYKGLVDEGFSEMRKALDIRPYDTYCDSLEEVMKHKEDLFLLLEGAEVIGAVTCLQNEIENVVVSPRRQRQGYGRKLMEFALSHMRERGDSPIRLTVTQWNRAAIALYERLGFEVTKERVVEGVSTQDASGTWSFEFTTTSGLSLR